MREAHQHDENDRRNTRREQRSCQKQQRERQACDERLALGHVFRNEHDTDQIADRRSHQTAYAQLRRHVARQPLRLAVKRQRIDRDDLGTHIQEQADRPEPEIGIVQQRAALMTGLLAIRLDIDLGQLRREPDHQREQNQHDRDADIGHDDLLGKHMQLGNLIGAGQTGDLGRYSLDVREQETAQQENTGHAGNLVADAHDTDALRSALDRAENRHIRIRGGLQQREPGPLQEQSEQEQRIAAVQCGRNEQNRTDGHSQQPVRHAPDEPAATQHPRRRNGHDEIGNVKSERHEIGLEIGEFAYLFQKGNQHAVDPRDETENEKERTYHVDASGCGIVLHSIQFRLGFAKS